MQIRLYSIIYPKNCQLINQILTIFKRAHPTGLRSSSSKQFFVKFYVGKIDGEFALFDSVYDLDGLVVERRGNVVFSAEFADDAVDKTDLALLAVAQILQHAGNEFAVLFHGYGDQRKGDRLFKSAPIVE